MARAAVNAKAKAKTGAKQAPAPQRRHSGGGRRRHAAGGNPNQQLFFMRLRRQAKWVYVLLAVLFAVTFAFLGVGSGSGSGLDQLFNGLHIFGGGGNDVAKAQKIIKEDPNKPEGYRKLATAYEGKGDTGNAVSALQDLTRIQPKNASAWSELGGLQLSQANDYLTQYQQAYQARQLATPSASFLPSGKLGTALGTNKVEQVAAQRVDTVVSDLQQRTQLAYNNALTSYDQVTQLTPKDANAWFQMAQTAQQAGNYSAALKGYKRYLKLNPGSSNRAQIEQLIKQLGPAAASSSASGG
jgi:cytochrome c-type biogenesis protein CcmH/NrfG